MRHCRRVLFITMLLPAILLAADAPNPKVQKEYDAALQQADVANHPERHATLATWCRNNRWAEQAAYHEREAARHQFSQEKAKLKAEPTAADRKRLLDLAVRLKLDAEQSEARKEWLGTEIKERRGKIKEGDAAGLKALLAFADKEGGGDAATALAKEVLALDAKDETANLLLGRLKDGEAWVDPWDLLVKKGGLKNVKVRYEIHSMVEKLRKEPARAFPPDPWAGTEQVSAPNMGGIKIWKTGIKGLGDGTSTVFLWAPKKYSAAKKWPLIVYLHGGGSGGIPASHFSASNNLGSWPSTAPDCEFVVIAPTVRVHPINAWNVKENMLDVVDAIIDACERFNIDRKRIYLMGGSMGGQGTSRFSWVVPELFAAFSPQAGAYWNDYPVPDLEGKPFLVLHGAKDEQFRNVTCVKFLEKIRAAKATVEYVEYPNMGHNLDDKICLPKTLGFFKPLENAFAPDLRLARRIIEETVTEKPHDKK